MSEASDLLAEVRKDLRELEEATESSLWIFAAPIETAEEYRERKIEMKKRIIKSLEWVESEKA